MTITITNLWLLFVGWTIGNFIYKGFIKQDWKSVSDDFIEVLFFLAMTSGLVYFGLK